MNKPLIQDLISRFLQSYDSVAKDTIWQRQSAAFQKFWSEQVLAQGHGIVRMTELTRDSQVVTLDRADFTVYRRNGRDVIPVIAPAAR